MALLSSETSVWGKLAGDNTPVFAYYSDFGSTPVFFGIPYTPDFDQLHISVETRWQWVMALDQLNS